MLYTNIFASLTLSRRNYKNLNDMNTLKVPEDPIFFASQNYLEALSV